MSDLRCSKCDKKLSRKTARMIDNKVLCSACVFPPMKPLNLGHSIGVRKD